MQGKRHFEPKMFYDVSLEKIVPADHKLRRFDSLMSFDFLYEETGPFYSRTGQPSVDPVVLFKMMLLGYLYDLSERELAVEIQVNMAFRWYLGYDLDEDTPNHSVLSKARSRFSEDVFGSLFSRVVEMCARAGLVRGEALHVDSTLIKANASLDSFVEVRRKPEEYIRRVYGEGGSASPEPEAGAEALPVKEEPPGRFSGEVDPSKMGRRRQTGSVNRKWRSTTDPEAEMVYRKGKGRQSAYKGHFGVDSGRVITAVEVTGGTADDTVALETLLGGHKAVLGELPARIAADSHYGSSEVYHYLDGLGIEAVIPPRRTKSRPGFFTLPDFKYDEAGDFYICPEGRRLDIKSNREKLGRKEYRADGQVCAVCPQRARCTKAQKAGRSLEVDSFFGAAERLIKSCRGRHFLKERQTTIEGVFGEAKSNHSMQQARFRGKVKLKIQLLLTAVVLNLKRLLKGRKNKKGAALGTPSSFIFLESILGIKVSYLPECPI